jgi:glycosyltransferase involved in cell wall biosynthesis
MDTFPGYSFKTSPKLDIIFKLFFKTVGKLAFIASDFITVYGNSFVDYAKKAGIPSRKIKITPTGIDLIPKPRDINVKELLGITENEKIILFVGLYNNRKGIDLIIKTAKILEDEDVKFVLVGDGPERIRSINLIRELGLSNKIIFVGTRFDVHNFYKSADVFLLPSRGEGLAGVLMEAMLYQVPIVSSDIAGTRDLITHKENGLLCEVENYNCYANSIIYLLQKKDVRMKLQQNGIKKIEKGFLWKNNIHKFENLYQYSKP